MVTITGTQVSSSGNVNVGVGGASPSSSGSFFGTYNPSTGVYTSPSGVQQSMAQAPQGATIIGGGLPVYTGNINVGKGGAAPDRSMYPTSQLGTSPLSSFLQSQQQQSGLTQIQQKAITQQQIAAREGQSVIYQTQVGAYKDVPILQTRVKEYQPISTPQGIQYKPVDRLATAEERAQLKPVLHYIPTAKEIPVKSQERVAKSLSEEKARIRTQQARGETTPITFLEEAGLGLGTSLMGSVQFLQQITKEPIKTVTSLPSATYQTGKSVITKITSGELSKELAINPASSIYYGTYMGTEVVQAYAIGKAGDLAVKGVKAGITRILPSYRGITTTALGEKFIENIPIKTKETFSIGLIPERGAKLKIQPEKFVGEYGIKTPTAKLPRLTADQKLILAEAKQQGAVISGSFAQKIMYPKARQFKDIDIVVEKPTAFLSELSGKYKVTEVTTGRTAGLVKLEGKGLAVDIAPTSFYKGGIKTTERLGYNIVKPEILLENKARILAQYIDDYSKFGREKFTKAISDIDTLALKKIDIDVGRATLTGPYGYTKAEQLSYVGKTGKITTSARDLFGVFKKEIKIVDETGAKAGIWATPWDIKTGKPQTRITRLGIETKDASIKDILRGDVTFKAGKPQIVVFKGTIGKDWKLPLKSSELEVISGITEKTGRIAKAESRLAVTIIKGKPVWIYEGKLVKPTAKTSSLLRETAMKSSKGILSEGDLLKTARALSRETGIDYTSQLVSKPYFSPYRFTGISKFAISSEPIKSKQLRSSEMQIRRTSQLLSEPRYTIPYKLTPRYKTPYRLPPVSRTPSRMLDEPRYTPPYRPTRYPPPYRLIPPLRPPYYPTKKRFTPPIPIPGKLTDLDKGSKSLRKELGYDVFKISKGKPQLVAKGLRLGSAKDIQVRTSLKDLTATTFLKKSDLMARDISTSQEFARFSRLFREPTRKSRYRKLGLGVMIQRSRKVPGLGTGRLTFRGEKKQIQEARLRKLMEAIR